MNWKQILDDILELNERITVIKGYADMILGFNSSSHKSHHFKEIKEDNFWVIMGKDTTEMIIEALVNHEHELDCEGEYEFCAVLKFIPGECDEYGRCTQRDYLEVVYAEFHLIQTFKQRERQTKLDSIIDDDPFNQFFKI
jgi:hypothetical protein